MAPEDKDKLIEKLAAIKRGEESAREVGNEEEAQMFAATLRSLLLKHNLSMTEVEFRNQDQVEPVDNERVDWSKYGIPHKARRIRWVELLGNVVTNAHGCRILVVPGSNTLYIVGRKSNRELAGYVLAVLVRSAEKLAQKSYDVFYWQCEKTGTQHRARGYKASFLNGFINRIAERYEDQTRTVDADPSTCTAIVRINSDLAAVNRWVQEQTTKKAAPLMGRRDHCEVGYRAGIETANQLDITGRAVEAQATKRKELPQ